MISMQPEVYDSSIKDPGERVKIIEPGQYLCRIVAIEENTKLGKPLNTDKPFAAIHLDTGNGVVIDVCWLTDKAMWRFARYLRAANCVATDPQVIYPAGMLNRTCVCDIGIERRQGNSSDFENNSIDKVTPPPAESFPDQSGPDHVVDLSNAELANVDPHPGIQISQEDLPF